MSTIHRITLISFFLAISQLCVRRRESAGDSLRDELISRCFSGAAPWWFRQENTHADNPHGKDRSEEEATEEAQQTGPIRER